MVLSDKDILEGIKAGRIEIVPFDRARLGTNSYDLTLSKHLASYQIGMNDELDCKIDNPINRFEIPENGICLYPGILYLGSTEQFTRTRDYMPYIEGKSSIGRLGITAHITAGAGDIGFEGHWTLEITVVHPIRVYAGMPIGQILYMVPLSSPIVPYSLKPNAKYNKQSHLPMPSQMFRNFTKEV